MPPLPTIDDVDKIAQLGEAPLRNVLITQCYYELSLAFTERTGRCANWCTFATWASKQAGQTIRKEDLKRALQQFLATTPATTQAAASVTTSARQLGAKQEPTIPQLIWETLNPAAAMERASDAVARGNQKVFAEIGREFARFAATCQQDKIYTPSNIEEFCATLKPGDPPDGQRYLQQAFTHYYQSFFEQNAKTKAELILLANIEIGLHEQTRLQPEIAEALEAALITPFQFTYRILGALFPRRSWLVLAAIVFMRLFNRRTQLDESIDRLFTTVQHHIRLFLTEHMMVLCFPNELRLKLGTDLKAKFPLELQQVAYADLRILLEQIDPTPDSLNETGAIDWADLPDRLHYIADLFRCFQQKEDLLLPPFTDEQVMIMKNGKLPEGEL